MEVPDQLAEAFRAGSEDALNQIFRPLWRYLVALGALHKFDVRDSEELADDVIMELLKNRKKLRTNNIAGAAAKTFLFRLIDSKRGPGAKRPPDVPLDNTLRIADAEAGLGNPMSRGELEEKLARTLDEGEAGERLRDQLRKLADRNLLLFTMMSFPENRRAIIRRLLHGVPKKELQAEAENPSTGKTLVWRLEKRLLEFARQIPRMALPDLERWVIRFVPEELKAGPISSLAFVKMFIFFLPDKSQRVLFELLHDTKLDDQGLCETCHLTIEEASGARREVAAHLQKLSRFLKDESVKREVEEFIEEVAHGN